MSFNINIQTSASPAAVLSAVQDDLREWRESAIPAEARDSGVLRVYGTVRGNTFRLWSGRRSRSFTAPVLSGRVLPTPGGGSNIVARCAPQPRALLGVPLVAVLLAWNILAGADGSAIVDLLLLGAFFGGIHLVQSLAITPELTGARLLATRLQNTVARVDSAWPASHTEPANEC